MTTRLLVTGAGGALGRHARQGLKGSAKVLRLSDISDLAPPDDGEEVVRCDLDDRLAVSPRRPDSLYGVSKCFGEDLARLYFDKYGLETACLRIGSCFPEPTNQRMLSTWLSPRDFLSLVRRLLEAPSIGYLVLYGASANRDAWWSNAHADFLGWQPMDSSEPFRQAIERREPGAAEGSTCQGGRLATVEARPGD